MRILPFHLAASAVLTAAPLAAQGVGVLDVSVVEGATSRPLAGVRVEVASQHVAAVTGPDGMAVLRGVKAGPQLLEVSRIGYAPVSAPLQVAPGDSVPLEISLSPTAVRVPGVTATVQMRPGLRSAGYYTRRDRGMGVFLGPEEMEAHERDPLHITLGRQPGVRVVASWEGGIPHYHLVNPRSAASSLRGTCAMQVYLDGVIQSDTEIDQIPAESVAAAEIYRGPSEIPPEYNTTSLNRCGVLLLWTRDR